MTRQAALRMLVLGLIWGCSFYFIELALRGVSPAQVVLGRVLSGTATMWLIVLVRRTPVIRDRVVWLHAFAIAVVSQLLPFFLFAWGAQRVTSGIAGVANGTTPLMTLLVALVALPDERPDRDRVLGLLLGVVGIVLLVQPWQAGDNSVSGVLACLGAAASYGVGFNYTRRFLAARGLAPEAVSVAQLSASTLLLLVASPLIARGAVDLTPQVVGALLMLGVFGTGIAFAMYHALIRDIGATRTSMVTFLIPVVAIVLGVVALGEDAGWNLLAGGALVAVGVAVAEGRFRRRQHAAPPAVEAPAGAACEP